MAELMQKSQQVLNSMLLLFGHSVVSDSFETLWTVARQVPLSMGFLRQEYWSGLPFPSPVDFPYPGIEPASLASSALAGGFFTTNATWKVPDLINKFYHRHPFSEFSR